MRKRKVILIIVCAFVFILLASVAVPFAIFGIRSQRTETDYAYLFRENRIRDVKIDNVPLVHQEISCGYAIIQMLSSYYGNPVTESDLYEQNGQSVSTSSTAGFVREINRTIPGKDYVSKEYMAADEMILEINRSLLSGDPVAVEWAAQLDGEWTLHWSVVTGMDQEHVYISNPYGYTETISYAEFISRTTFRAFDPMPFGYYFGFAYGLFSKNTIIVPKG